MIDSITSYSQNELQEFSKELRVSRLTRAIDDTNSSIVGNEVTMKLKKSINPTLNEKLNYLYPNGHRITHQMRWFKGSRDRGFKSNLAA